MRRLCSAEMLRQEVVDQKESVVAKLDSIVARVSGAIRGKALEHPTPDLAEHQKLALLKTEAKRLIHLNHQIDSKNLMVLQELKSQTIQSSHELQQGVPSPNRLSII